MKRVVWLFILLVTISAFSFAGANVQDIIITPTKPTNLTIKVWTDKSVGSTYYQGESIHIYFKTSQNAYVTLYDFTPEGGVRIIFPNFFQRNNFVKGGIVYAIPNPSYNYDLTVSGQNGREMIEAIATTSPKVLPPAPSVGNQPFAEVPNGLDFMKSLKIKIAGKSIAVDTTYFYVGYVPKTGVVHFTSNPSGLSLFVDGVSEGKTPKDLRLAEGNHLAVFWYGLKKISKLFTVQAGTYQTVSANMPVTPIPPKPINIRVNVNTNPFGALVFVNGKMLGVSPCVIELPQGTYEFTILKPDYHTLVQKMVISNYTKNININLSSIATYNNW